MHQAESSSSLFLFMDWSFASGCSPPRLSTTQLPSATDRPVLLSDEDFHLTVGAYSQAHSSTAVPRSCSCGLFPWAAKLSLRFRPKNMTQHIFPFESELQNNRNEVAPSSPNFSLSVSEKLSRYGVNALSDVEHLGLLVGKETLAARLLKHFGSLKALTKASAVELGAFMTTHKAERLVAALAVSARAQAQNSFQEPFDSPETVYRSCLDMQAFQQEVLRVVLLDARFRRITAVDITKGTVNESLAHPREIFRPAISHSAYALVVVHNHPSGDVSPSEADTRLTRRIAEAARILQIQLLDHVIVGQPLADRQGYFSFKEAGVIS